MSSKNNEHPVNNLTLADIFHQMAVGYRYIGNEERFRALAYEKVSKILFNMKEDIAMYAMDIHSLDAIPGIGESIAEKIIEYLETCKIQTFEDLKAKLPYELLELMEITGFGPATLKVLHEQLHFNNRQDLVNALSKGELKGINGFGTKKIENLEKALKLNKTGGRIQWKEGEKIGRELILAIRKINGVQKAEVAGSIRRKMETIGDIDIVIVVDPKYRKRIGNQIIGLPQVMKVLVKGMSKVSVIIKERNMQVDIRLVNTDEFGAALLYSTGSKEHSIQLRVLAKEMGYKLNEYGLFDDHSDKKLAGDSEEAIYNMLGLKFIPPEKRLGESEIEVASLKD